MGHHQLLIVRSADVLMHRHQGAFQAYATIRLSAGAELSAACLLGSKIA